MKRTDDLQTQIYTDSLASLERGALQKYYELGGPGFFWAALTTNTTRTDNCSGTRWPSPGVRVSLTLTPGHGLKGRWTFRTRVPDWSHSQGS